MAQRPDWPTCWTAIIGQAVRDRRKNLGWSAKRLSERCSELGLDIPRYVITNLETGRKESIPLHQVVVLARALETSPLALAVPAPNLGDEFLIGNESMRVEDAVEWFAGMGIRLGDDWLDRWREYEYWEDRISASIEALSSREVLSNPKLHEQYQRTVDEQRSRLREVADRIRGFGERIPQEIEIKVAESDDQG